MEEMTETERGLLREAEWLGRQLRLVEAERDSLKRLDDQAERTIAALQREITTLRNQIAAGEKTRSAPVKYCERCGKELNNVSPGWAVVADWGEICVPCLKPTDRILARAK